MSIFTPDIQNTTKNNTGAKLLWSLCNQYSTSVGAFDNHDSDPEAFLKARNAIIQFFTVRMTKRWVFDWKAILDSKLFDLSRLQWDIEILMNISNVGIKKHAIPQLKPIDAKIGLFIQKEVKEYEKIVDVTYVLKMRTVYIGIDGYHYRMDHRPNGTPTLLRPDARANKGEDRRLEWHKKKTDETDESSCVIC